MPRPDHLFFLALTGRAALEIFAAKGTHSSTQILLVLQSRRRLALAHEPISSLTTASNVSLWCYFLVLDLTRRPSVHVEFSFVCAPVNCDLTTCRSNLCLGDGNGGTYDMNRLVFTGLLF